MSRLIGYQLCYQFYDFEAGMIVEGASEKVFLDKHKATDYVIKCFGDVRELQIDFEINKKDAIDLWGFVYMDESRVLSLRELIIE